MELANEFVVGVGVEEAWALLTDLEAIAPCMPGAELQEISGEEFRGVVKVKVGPITTQYKGKAMFLERDSGAHRAVLRAEGRDTRGQGNASATITANLVPEGTGTVVKIVTDLTITGRAAQFGRGVLADISRKLIDQFVQSLEADLLDRRRIRESAADLCDGSAAPLIVAPAPVAAVDLLGTAGMPVAKRLAPVAAAVVVVLWISMRARHRRAAN